jgi:hypothetical protein
MVKVQGACSPLAGGAIRALSSRRRFLLSAMLRSPGGFGGGDGSGLHREILLFDDLVGAGEE